VGVFCRDWESNPETRLPNPVQYALSHGFSLLLHWQISSVEDGFYGRRWEYLDFIDKPPSLFHGILKLLGIRIDA